MSAAVRPRYSALARSYHWITFALVAAAYLTINLRGMFERGSEARTLVVESHFVAGLAVLLLVVPRLLNRIGERAPPIAPPLPAWMRALSHLTHGLLYAFLVVQPLLGVTTRLAEGKGVGLPFTERVIPSFFGARPGLAETLEPVHIWLGEAFYWVIGLHILAALYHWAIRRDNTLQRMA
ncbi:cytochrome b [Xanthomonas sp. Kuri4-1]